MKIIHERKKCIGCGSCAAVCPKYWEMAEDGKATLIGSVINSKEVYELEIKKLDCNQEAADSCPINIIKVKNVKDKS
ncbi:MAG: ferredoxin [Candidatus Pacebacteria bacterium]|nr:ferredoxin [Candidatus Paceibacterota bacterium]